MHKIVVHGCFTNEEQRKGASVLFTNVYENIHNLSRYCVLERHRSVSDLNHEWRCAAEDPLGPIFSVGRGVGSVHLPM